MAVVHGGVKGSAHHLMVDAIPEARLVFGTWGKLYDLAFPTNPAVEPAFNAEDYAIWVLEEADATMEHDEKTNWLYGSLPRPHQLIYISGTATDSQLARMGQHAPDAAVYINHDTAAAAAARHHHILRLATTKGKDEWWVALENEKLDFIRQLYASGDLPKALLFCKTRESIERIAPRLLEMGVELQADPIHGKLSQGNNVFYYTRFKQTAQPNTIVVCSDILHRGFHIRDLRFIVNFDMPMDWVAYYHRACRAGRDDPNLRRG